MTTRHVERAGNGPVLLLGAFVLILAFGLADGAWATVVTVDTATDSLDGNTASIAALIAGPGADGFISLREAITACNNTLNSGGPDDIDFSIAGAGPHTITVTSALPTIGEAVDIDGTTEPDYVTAPVIILNGNDVVAAGLTLNGAADGSTIRGLLIRNFNGDGISIQSGSDGNTIVSNYIGRLNPDGTPAASILENDNDGIDCRGANNIIGGVGTRNVVSGNDDDGIGINGSAATGNQILGNYIGTTGDGMSGLGNGDDNGDGGVRISGASNNTVGASGAGNVISSNTGSASGILISGNSDNITIKGNLIGTAANGTSALGNSGRGIYIQGGGSAATSPTGVVIGGTGAGEANTIAYNSSDGVDISGSASGVSISANSIHSNSGLGIDLGSNGVTANDAGDGDTGPNNLQNFPLPTSAYTTGTDITISGTFNSAASTTFRIEFFANTASDPTGYGEGQRYLGFADVTTDGSGNVAINTTLTVVVAVGEIVTANAADPSNNTSEFGYMVAAAPAATPGISVAPTLNLTTTEAGGTASFTVLLNTQPTADVTIGLSSSDLTEGTVAPASLTFTAANWNVAQTVTVTGVDDPWDDGNVAFTIITAAATSADPAYNGLNASDVAATNQNNDFAGVTVSAISGPTTEAGGTASFTMVLTCEPTADVTIPISSNDLTEGTVALASLTFTGANWNVAQTVTVTGVDDLIDDGNISFNITTAAATSADPAYNGLNPSNRSVTNNDDDTAGINVSAISGPTTEAGGTASFTVVLACQPTADVTIGLSSSDLTEGTVAPASLTFTALNWNVAQTVTVTGVDDFLDDGDVAYSIVTAAATSTDPAYNGLNASDVAVTNQDDDTAGITVSALSGPTTEAGGTASFTVVLDSQPTADVTIGLSSSDLTEGTVAPVSLTFIAASWNVAQTVTVTGVDDPVDDGDQTYSIVTAAATSADPAYNGINAGDVAVTNTDDDTAGITVSAISGPTTEAGGTATFTVVLDSQPIADVTIGLSSSDLTEGTVAPASLTFTAANWNVAQTVTVTGVDDLVDDGDVAYSIVTAAATSADPIYDGINASDVAVTNTDDDTAGITVSAISGPTTEAGGTATFAVVLNTQPTADVTIGLSSSDLSEGTVAPASLTFTAANWNVAQTATVTGVDDPVDDGDQTYSIVTAAAVSADPIYNGINPADVAVTNQDDDTAGITVSAISGPTTEAGGTATFTVVLDSQPTADVTIGLSSSDLTEGTVAPASLTFTAGNWNVAQTVTMTGVDDLVDDGDVAYSIVTAAATSADPAYNGINAGDVAVTNQDDDTAGITVSAISEPTTEAGGTATFTVVLNTQPAADVTIGLSSSDLTEGTVAPASLTFTAGNWNVAQTATVTGVDDLVDDGDVAYSIVTAAATSADPAYNGINAGDVAVTNTDDDTAGITVSAISGPTTEAGGTATFTVVLNTQPTADVTIGLSSSDLTEGTVPASVTFTAANWNVAQTVTVTGVDDLVDDGDVAYSIVTAAATSADPIYDGINASDVAVTNTDDDTAGITVSAISGPTTEAGGTATFTVVLNTQPAANVTVGLSSSDLTEGTVAAASLTFTAVNWNVAQTVTVTGVDDPLDDGDIAYSIVTAAATSTDPTYNGVDPSDVSMTNTDDDTAGITVNPTAGLTTTEAGGTATFTVVLDTEPTADVTIGLSSSDLTEGTVAPASLTFTSANWNVAQTVTVTGVDDAVQDGAIGYTIVTAPATSTDPTYNGVDPSDVSVTNTDDDTAGITVNPIAGLTTTEASGTATFTVVLNTQPTANVTIGLTSSDLTEGTVAPASVTFTTVNWNVAQTVTVTGVDDPLDDGDIAYSIVTAAATSTDPTYNGVDPSDVSVTNTDDDTAGIAVNPIAGLTTTEASGTATFTVVLDSQPTADVTIGLSSSDLTEGTVAPASLAFTALNWNVAQTVTVTGVDDALDDGDIAYTIVTAAATSADAAYNGLDPANVAVTNQDNDTAGITVSAVSGPTNEAGGTATFTVVLDSQPTADVTVGLSSSDLSEGTVAPASVTFTALNWNTPQTVTVTGADDPAVDGAVAYGIVTAAATSTDGNYNGLDPSNVAVTNQDNDTAGITVSAISGPTTEAGGTATFTVVLTSQPTADVTVGLSSSDLSEGTVAPASVTFTALNWNVAQTVTVTGADDPAVDGAVAYSIVTAAATSTDGNYNGLDPSNVAVTNQDDDTAGITVSAISGPTTEAGGTATFTVVLDSQPTADVTVGLSSSDVTEGTVAQASVTFTALNWNVAQTLTVTGVDDSVDDGDVVYIIVTAVATSTDGNYNGIDPADVGVTNNDNDAVGITVAPVAGLVTTEAGGTATFTVVLASQPSADVTVGLTSSDLTEGTVAPVSVTFTAVNWNLAQTITVMGLDETIVDGNRAYSVVLGAASSADANYNGLDPSDVSLTNTDNDTQSTIVVTTVADITDGDTSSLYALMTNNGADGHISLREAITAADNTANGAGGADRIHFSIPDALFAGAHTINVGSTGLGVLPAITEATVIDGTTEPDFGTAGDGSPRPVVELNGTNSGAGSDGLAVTMGSGTIIRGLVINRFTDDGIAVNSTNVTIAGNILGLDVAGTLDRGNSANGILINGAGNTIGGTSTGDRNVIAGNNATGIRITGAGATGNLIQGNYVGLNAVGTAAVGNVQEGVYVASAGNTIGGTTATARNVIAGNASDGIYIGGGATSANNVIQGNYIGTTAAGNVALGNQSEGITIDGALNTLIGGTTAGAGNVIAASAQEGIWVIAGAAGTVIQGNSIGTDVTGTVNLGNNVGGIRIGNASNPSSNNLIGGTVAGAGNVLAFNVGVGIAIDQNAFGASVGNAVLGNAIHSNSGLGIDLDDAYASPSSAGVTANDVGDTDTGGNNRQNFPVLTGAVSSGGNTTISGTFNSTASTTFRIEFFSSPTGDASGYGEGQTYLGSTTVTTAASGNATFNTTLTGVSVNVGHVVSATATVDLGGGSYGSTSEFAQNVTASAPRSISGIVFEDVSYGGGAGRDLASSSGAARPGARVELYDGAGSLSTFATTDGAGAYAFSSLAPGNYTVRVVNQTVSSSRTGYLPTLRPVQTYRTDASTGTAVAVTDRVGGEEPAKVDAGDGSTTLAALTTPTTTAQSITAVTVTGSDITGVDCGFNFDTIVNVNDTGQGSLRGFLNNANAMSNGGLAQSGRQAGIDNSIFMISNGTAAPGLRASLNYFSGGAATIVPTSALPTLTDPVVLDGTTQPGFAGSPIIELNGSSSSGGDGLTLSAGNSAVRGLVINRFLNDGLVLTGGGNNEVEGNYVGTDVSGTVDLGNGRLGIYIDSDDNLIGGTTAAKRNVISGNDVEGLGTSNGPARNRIVGNYIGTDVTGTIALGNGGDGVHLHGPDNILGGTTPAERNIVSASQADGVEISGATATGNVVQGNYVGTDASGTAPLPNGGVGIHIHPDASNNTVGGTAPGAGNVIAFNGLDGVIVNDASPGNTIRGNSFFSNGELGIDLGDDGVSLNDSGDGDTGANDRFNFPILVNAVISGGILTLTGFARPGSTIEVFVASPDPSGFGEGQAYLATLVEGSALDTDATMGTYGPGPVNGILQGTDTTNRFLFLMPAPPGVVPGTILTATASLGGTTSEFSGNVTAAGAFPGITVTPISGPTTEAGGTATFTVVLNSQPTADVTIGLSSNDLTEGTVAPAGLTFTALNWNVAQTVTVTGVDDAVVDGAVAYSILTAVATSTDGNYNGIDPADVAVSNSDDDAAGITVAPVAGLVTTEAGGTATFTVVLDSQPTADVTIGLSSSDLTEGTVAPVSLTFTAPNWNVAQTVTVTGVDDVTNDGDIAYSVLTAPGSSADGAYAGLDPADVGVTNLNDDTAGITVAPVAGLVTTEAGGTATFTVVLNGQPGADVTIGIASGDLTEGTALPASLTFTSLDWNVPQSIDVTGVDDQVDDGDVAYGIVTSAAVSADPTYNGLPVADVSATNLDDDTAGIPVSTISGPTTEAGGTATFTVVLSTQPTADVTIMLSSSDVTEGTVSPGVLTFTAASWNVAQTVTVSGVDDVFNDGDVVYSVLTAPAIGVDPEYSGRDAADVALSNQDDDSGAAVQLELTAGLERVEMGEPVPYTLIIRNLTATRLTGLTIEHALPPRFGYLAETAARDGRPHPDPTGESQRRFAVDSLAAFTDLNGDGLAGPGEPGYATLTWQLVPGAGATPGTYVAMAEAALGCSTCIVSNRAEASVGVEEASLFARGTVLGRVFEDTNRDGLQGHDEQGVPAAVVALDDGTSVATDAEGRFHVPDLEPGPRVLKLDVARLGLPATPTTDVTQVVHLSPGLLATVRFGVSFARDTVKVGRPDVEGLAILTESPEPAVDVAGNVLRATVVVNGRQVPVRSADVRLSADGLDEVLRLSGDRLESPVTFVSEVTDQNRVKGWRLEVQSEDGEVVRVFKGRGAPPARIDWDGSLAGNRRLEGGQVYMYQVNIEYEDGALVLGPRRAFGVDRRTSISVTMTGDAFETAAAVLSPAAQEELSKLARVMRRAPGEVVIVEGHSDSVGSARANLLLSRKRAEAALRYLVEHERVPRERLVVRAYGEERPVASNATPQGRELNRRIEIHGQATELKRARLYDIFRGRASAWVGTTEVPVDSAGRFACRTLLSAGDTLGVALSDRQGRFSIARLRLPRLEILEPRGEVRLPFGGSADGVRIESRVSLEGGQELLASAEVVVAERAVAYIRLSGRTDSGSRVEVDGSALAVGPDGGFTAELPLHVGQNTFGVVVRSPQGALRIANLVVRALDRAGDGGAVIAVERIPDLTVYLPPRGTVLSTPELALAGRTRPGYSVLANGDSLVVDAQGAFSGRVILPEGPSVLRLVVEDPEGHRGVVEREIEVRSKRLFLVALADGVVGHTSGVTPVGSDSRGGTWTEGRLAYQLRGWIGGRFLITSALDTRRRDFGSLFSDLDDAGRDRLLVNLDPDRLYPVYGDASAIAFGAPGGGRFFLAVESDVLRASVGDYPIAFDEVELAAFHRSLYGAQLRLGRPPAGEGASRGTAVALFGAEAGHVHVRDEIRATGGTLYYLSHSEIVEGSVQVALVVRDRDNGLPLARMSQRPGTDFTVKDLEGRLLFSRPVPSVWDDGSLVDGDGLHGHPVTIEVDYETRGSLAEKTAVGGRVRQAVGPWLDVGGTAVNDQAGSGSYELRGADATLRFGTGSRIVGELAESDGRVGRTFASDDGGLAFSAVDTTAVQRGRAWKAVAELDVGEWFRRPGRLRTGGYVKQVETGFVSQGQPGGTALDEVGLRGQLDSGRWGLWSGRFDRETRPDLGTSDSGAVRASEVLGLQWRRDGRRLGGAAEFEQRSAQRVLAGASATSTGAASLRWSPVERLRATVERQQTLSGTPNDRSALALEWQVLPSLSVEARGSDGTTGRALRGGIILTLGGHSLYVREERQEESGGYRHGTLLGAQAPLGPLSRAYSEYQWQRDAGGVRAVSVAGLEQGWRHTSGITLTVAGEHGSGGGATGGGERTTVSSQLTYRGRFPVAGSTRGEYRGSSANGRVHQILTATHLELKLVGGFAVRGDYRLSLSKLLDTGRTPTRFEESSVGLVYRPPRSDRVQALARWTQLADRRTQSPNDTLESETELGVAALEASVRLRPGLEWAGKGAVRFVRDERSGLPSAAAHSALWVSRLEYTVTHPLRLGLEYRLLSQREAADRRGGWLQELSWDAVQHVRLGIGYNFTRFSSELLDRNSEDAHGWFFRVQNRY